MDENILFSKIPKEVYVPQNYCINVNMKNFRDENKLHTLLKQGFPTGMLLYPRGQSAVSRVSGLGRCCISI